MNMKEVGVRGRCCVPHRPPRVDPFILTFPYRHPSNSLASTPRPLPVLVPCNHISLHPSSLSR